MVGVGAMDYSWVQYFEQDVYHASILPLLVVTAALAYFARPSTKGERIPDGFRSFQARYLGGWTVCVAADWVQGPFVYALYAEYGFTHSEIAKLFVVGYASSMFFGCFVGTVADKFGRKRCCIAYCMLYIMSCLATHFQAYNILMLGRVAGGIGTSLLFSVFESWMVSEHVQKHGFSGELLSFMFGLKFSIMYMAAIAFGFIGDAIVSSAELKPIAPGSSLYTGGYSSAFDIAIVCLVVGLVVLASWEENYGLNTCCALCDDDDLSPTTSLSSRLSDRDADGNHSGSSMLDHSKSALCVLLSDRRVFLLGVAVAAFESAMYAFVFNWTRALDTGTAKPPHGVIFALFMMACMCGASLATLLGDLRPTVRLGVTFASGAVAFSLSALYGGQYLSVSFGSFLLFEFCCGLYFPTVGMLKSEIVPEHVRSTIYNLYRVPMNLAVVALLLSEASLRTCFTLNALMLVGALGSVLAIHAMHVHDPPRAEMELNTFDIESPCCRAT